ncbi:MAG: DUF1501 domain-containing protein [Planctomycetaceae bacterium]|nr:DUF1501 domain-containing protein [Planctomycetaceae bacterium]
MFTRRELLSRAGGGMGMLALSSLLRDNNAVSSPVVHQPTQKAKSVIWLFMNGGPSGIDLFDPKPLLTKLDGKPFPGKLKTLFPYPGNIMKSPFEFTQHGETGHHVSSVFPHLAKHVDDLTFLNACVSNEQNHVPACYVVNTGRQQVGSPNLGSWATYGLANESRELPEYVVMYDRRAAPEGGANLWSSGFLPGEFQGTLFRPGKHPILHLDRPQGLSTSTQDSQLQLLNWLNRRSATHYPDKTQWEARTKSFEMAYQMQASVPELADLSNETAATHDLYGLNDPDCKYFGAQCLLARRMVEREVPFIQIYHGGYENNWDQHGDLAGGHKDNCYETDQPIAGLLTDLKQRGLLDSTLVIWGGEFGRAPVSQDKDGRDHNPYGFTMWMAGGGVKRGYQHGETDEFGYLPINGAVSMPDLHATVLHLMGINEENLTYQFGGRKQTATNGLGHAVHEIIA